MGDGMGRQGRISQKVDGRREYELGEAREDKGGCGQFGQKRRIINPEFTRTLALQLV